MAQINELPNEVLGTMTKSAGVDLSRVEPEAQDVIKPDAGSPVQPNHKQLQDVIAKMERENGPLKQFNVLLGQRERFNDNVKRLNQTQADDMLKQRADANRGELAKMFLGGK